MAAARLARIAGTAKCRLRYDESGPSGFEAAEPIIEGAVGAILAAYVVARAMADWPHFKLCAREGCGRAFYDASRSRTGRWCTKRCGNRVRGATYRRSRKRR